MLTDVANELHDNGALDEEECSVDAIFVMAKGGHWSDKARKRHENHGDSGSHGLPHSVSAHAANHHEVRLVSCASTST